MQSRTLLYKSLTVVGIGAICVAVGVSFGAIPLQWLTSTPASRVAGAGVVAVPAEIEFQSFDGDDIKDHKIEVTLKNGSNSQARILEIRTSCGCTVAGEPEAPLLQAGGSTRFTISVSPPAYGFKETVVTVATDAAATPIISIPVRLHGKKLKPPFVADIPEEIAVASNGSDSSVRQSFRVTCTEFPGEPFLTGFKSTNVGFVTTPPTIAEERNLDATTLLRTYESELDFSAISANATSANGLLTPELRETPTRPLIPIRVSWTRVAAIRASPTRIVLRHDGRNGETVTRRVILIGADQTEWAVTSAEADVDWLQLEVTGPSRHVIVISTRSGHSIPDAAEGDVLILRRTIPCARKFTSR